MHPDAILMFKRSDMILIVQCNASHLTEPNARSRAGGHFYLANEAEEEDPANRPVHNIAEIIRNLVTLAADAKIGALL